MRSPPSTNLSSVGNNNNSDLSASTTHGSGRDARPGFMRMGSFRGGGGGSSPSSSVIPNNNDAATASENGRPGFMRMSSERRMGRRRCDINNNNNGGNTRSFLQRRNSSYDVMMGNHSHHAHSQTPSMTSDVGVFGSFRRKSCDQQMMLQDLDSSNNSNGGNLLHRASVSDYQNVFQQMKQENPTTSMGALHHNTITKIAELKAFEEAKARRIQEEFLRQEEEERMRNQTIAQKYVDKWVDKLRLQPHQNEQSSSTSFSQEYIHNSNTTTTRGESLYSIHNSANLHNTSLQSMDNIDSHSPTVTNSNAPINPHHTTISAAAMQNSTSIRASFLRRVSAEPSNESSNDDDLNFAPRRSVGDLDELRNSAIADELLNHHSSHHSRRGSRSSAKSSRSSARRRKSKISSYSADSSSNDVDQSARSMGTKSSLGMLSDASGLFMNAFDDEDGSVVSTDDFSTSGGSGVSELSSTRGVEEATREEDDDTREGLLEGYSSSSSSSSTSTSTSNSRDFMQHESSPASVVRGIESPCDDAPSVAGSSKDATSEFDDDESMCPPRSDGLIVGFVDRSSYVYIKYDKDEEDEDGLIVGFVDRSESSKEDWEGSNGEQLISRGKREELLLPLRERTGKVEMGDRVFAAKPSPYAPVSKTKKKGSKWFKQKNSGSNSPFGYY